MNKPTVFKVTVLAAVFTLVHANPLPQTSGSCGAYENYDPYTDECVQYASASSCGMLGIVCASGYWCSNAGDWSEPGGTAVLQMYLW